MCGRRLWLSPGRFLGCLELVASGRSRPWAPGRRPQAPGPRLLVCELVVRQMLACLQCGLWCLVPCVLRLVFCRLGRSLLCWPGCLHHSTYTLGSRGLGGHSHPTGHSPQHSLSGTPEAGSPAGQSTPIVPPLAVLYWGVNCGGCGLYVGLGVLCADRCWLLRPGACCGLAPAASAGSL